MKHIRSPKVRIKWWSSVQLHDIFTSFQQAVSVSILHQVAIYGDVVQGLQRGALLHIFIGHRETGLGAIAHQTTTTTHTHTGAWGGVTVVTIITPITLFLLEVQFSCMLWLIYDRLSNSDIKKESSETISSHLIGVCVMPTLADTTVLSLSWQSLLDKSWIKYRFIPLCSVV